MEELRAEILEAERSRSDLLKWKLVLVAGLGAIGIGVQTNSGRVPLVLIGIPLVCAYVDLLCRHLTLRVHVIGQFLRSRPPQGPPADVIWKEQFFRSYEQRKGELGAARYPGPLLKLRGRLRTSR
jgi:hypothetical protein